MTSTKYVCGLTVIAGALLVGAGLSQTTLLPLDHPAIDYEKAPLNDRGTRVANDLDSGKLRLEHRKDETGYLASVLKALGVNQDSQALVFSKTSFQSARISPRNPRAIYFSDDVAVGYVRGTGLLEIASLDPKQGVVFYSFDQQADPPRLDRRDTCLQCHLNPGTLGIPGLLILSVFPDGDGKAGGGAGVTDHRSSFSKRWGGWYVTGTHGEMQHIGNALGHDPRHPDLLDMWNTQNQTSVEKKFGAQGYLSALSDIVALMTLEHQTRMTNLMIRAGWEARMGGEADVEALVTYMLFADEANFWSPVEGVSTFTKTFSERGPRDSQGRSLREFDLKKRMFRHPLSYMIYSDAFEGMPESVRARVYRRLYDVLTSKEEDKKFARLSEEDRRNVREIVRETKRGLPDYWK